MALIKCSECEKDISENALMCPGCGHAGKRQYENDFLIQYVATEAYDKTWRWTKKWFGIVSIIFTLLAFIGIQKYDDALNKIINNAMPDIRSDAAGYIKEKMANIVPEIIEKDLIVINKKINETNKHLDTIITEIQKNEERLLKSKNALNEIDKFRTELKKEEELEGWATFYSEKYHLDTTLGLRKIVSQKFFFTFADKSQTEGHLLSDWHIPDHDVIFDQKNSLFSEARSKLEKGDQLKAKVDIIVRMKPPMENRIEWWGYVRTPPMKGVLQANDNVAVLDITTYDRPDIKEVWIKIKKLKEKK